MKKFLLFLLLFSFTFAQVYVDSNLNNLLDNEEKVNVIVMLKNEDSKSMKISSEEIGIKIQNTISKTSIEIEKVRELNIINGFSTEVTRDDFEELKNNPNVEGIYYNYPIYLALDDSVPLINASDVWEIEYKGKNLTGQGQTVCVIDTGVDYTHPYLGNCTQEQFLNETCEKVIGGYDIYYNDSDPIDVRGHGTHCAGIIASTHPTFKGVAPGAKIVALNVFPTSGTTDVSYIGEGIQWCINHKDEYNISVISMSLGDGNENSNYCNSDYLTSYINSAVSNNISVVIATGNEAYTDGISSPACVESAIRVTATMKNNLFPNYANRGGNFSDIIAAPGSDITSTYPISIYPSGLAIADGTSMATPHVAGVIALYNQYYYDKYGHYVSPSEIKQKLNNTGYIIPDSASGKNYSRVDAYELFINIIYNVSEINEYYNNSNEIYFEINFSGEVSNVYVNMTLPNNTNEIIDLTNYSLLNYNGTYLIPNLYGNYSFVYVINDSGFIDYSELYSFYVEYDYICVNYSDCNSSLFEYEKVLLNNSIELETLEFFDLNDNTIFDCNNYEINNSNYIQGIGENTSIKNCIFNGEEFELNSILYEFNLFNTSFNNNGSLIYFNDVNFQGYEFITLNENVISNSINGSDLLYKINISSCDNLDVLYYENLTNSTINFTDSLPFVPSYLSCLNNSLLEFNSSLNGSYSYNNFNFSVENITEGNTNIIYNYTYLLNLTNFNLVNDNYTISFNSDNETIINYDNSSININSSNSYFYDFNVSSSSIGNHSINASICSEKLVKCYNFTLHLEIFDVAVFENVSIYPYVLSNNSNITFNLNVSNHDSIWMDITLPDLSLINLEYVENLNYTTNQIGVHNLTFYANDSYGYVSNFTDYFEVLDVYESNLTFLKNDRTLTNVSLIFYYRDQELFNFNIDNSSLNIYDLLYDLELNYSRLRLLFTNVSINNSESIYDEIEFGNYTYTILINNSFNFTNNYTLEINYSGLNYTNDTYLEFYKCSDWNFTNNSCDSIFENKNFTINTTTKIITYYDNTFSAFSILQGMYCGDDVCNNDETCSSCKIDCGSCPIKRVSGGGGGGGGGSGGTGGGSAILPKNARYQNITYDYYIQEYLQFDEYNMYFEKLNNSFKYTLSSFYEGDFCYNNTCVHVMPFEETFIISSNEEEIIFNKSRIDIAQKINFDENKEELDTEQIKFYLREYNESRKLEDKCSLFLGYHISPCVDKESCLFACRSVPLCSGLSNSEIFLNFSNYFYVNLIELNDLYNECYNLNNTNYRECVEQIYIKTKLIESSPLFGNCPTCLGVCSSVNYSYSSLNKILSILNDYEKQNNNLEINISEYNSKANDLNNLLDGVSEINKTISYSNPGLNKLIELHNNYSYVNSSDVELIEKEINAININISEYYKMDCEYYPGVFYNVNHFNLEFSKCINGTNLSVVSINETFDENQEIKSESEETNFFFIFSFSILVLVVLYFFKKIYH